MIEFLPSKQPFFFRRIITGAPSFISRCLSLRFSRKVRLVLPIVLLVLFGFFFVVHPAYALYRQVRAAETAIGELQAAFTTRDLEAIDSSLSNTADAILGLKRAYRRLGYLRLVPFLNQYYNDGEHLLSAASFALDGGKILTTSLKPFAGPLGLEGSSDSLLTVEQQVANLAAVLPQISSQIDAALGKIFLVKAELDQISAERYPDEIGGVKLRFWWEESRRILSDIAPLLREAKSLAGILPRFLGVPKRTYLILFQNDAELRATGGFITAVGFITVENGRVKNLEVHDVGFATNRISAEPTNHPVARYLRTPGLLFHDANYSPDFKISAEKVLEFWRRGAGLPPVDSVIAINTGAAARVLEFTGPVGVPGYELDLAGYSWLPASCREGGKAFTSGNLVCRLEFWVERIGGNVRDERGKFKGAILGKFAEVLVEKLTESPAEVWAQLVDLGFEMLREKDLLLYSADSAEQQFFETLGFAGRVKDFDGDYLHISDSNLGGMKTDMFMQEAVEQSLVRLENGRWRKTVKISYYNPQPYDNWLSANYKNWVRVYVPLGSELVKIEGAYIDPRSWEELGKTVFGVFFYLWPQREKTITFTYDLPEGIVGGGEYRLLVQKQSGTNIGLVKVEVGGKMKSFDLKKDREITIPLK